MPVVFVQFGTVLQFWAFLMHRDLHEYEASVEHSVDTENYIVYLLTNISISFSVKLPSYIVLHSMKINVENKLLHSTFTVTYLQNAQKVHSDESTRYNI